MKNLTCQYVFLRCAEQLRTSLVFAIKKTLHAIEQNREDVKAKRDAWKESQSEMDIYKLVFLDESGINTGMTRLYGRSLSKDRIIDYVTDVRYERISILSSIRANGEMVPLVFEGALNGDLFKEYRRTVSIPKWMDEQVAASGLSLSRVLQDALSARLPQP